MLNLFPNLCVYIRVNIIATIYVRIEVLIAIIWKTKQTIPHCWNNYKIKYQNLQNLLVDFDFDFWCINNISTISWRPVLVVEKAGGYRYKFYLKSEYKNIQHKLWRAFKTDSIRRESPTMGKQLVNFISSGCGSSAPFFVIYKAGCELMPYWWYACMSCRSNDLTHWATRAPQNCRKKHQVDTPNPQIHDRSLFLAWYGHFN